MSKTNRERLPGLLQSKAAHEANFRDIAGAFRDKVKALREQKDPDTGKSVADMLAEEKKLIQGLDREIMQAWQFPDQTNMDLN
jgi:hypothetical protein